MKPTPVYKVPLYQPLLPAMRQSASDEAVEPRVLNFFFETVLPKTCRYSCGECRMVVPEGYFMSSPFRVDKDLPMEVMDEIAAHTKAHQIIGAAERRVAPGGR